MNFIPISKIGGPNLEGELKAGEDFLEKVCQKNVTTNFNYSKGEFVNKIIAKGRHGSLVVESKINKTNKPVAVKIISKGAMNDLKLHDIRQTLKIYSIC